MDALSERFPLLNVQDNAVRKRMSVKLILISAALERVSHFGLTSSYVYLVSQHWRWDEEYTRKSLAFYIGLIYLLSFPAGWLADCVVGRYYAIVMGLIIYAIGYLFLPATALYEFPLESLLNETTFPKICDKSTQMGCWILFHICGGLIVLGTALYRTNIFPFGGDQVRENGIEATRRFFNKLYWASNFGALAGIVPIGILTFYNPRAGMVACMVVLIASVATFLIGTKCYNRYPGQTKFFLTLFRVYSYARYTRQRRRESNQPTSEDLLDTAKISDGGQFESSIIDDIRRLRSLVLAMILMFPYWFLFEVGNSSYYQRQAANLRVTSWAPTCCCPFDSTNFSCATCQRTISLPVSALDGTDSFLLIMFIPLSHMLYKCLGRSGVKLFTWKRMLVGIIMIALSLLSAGIVEFSRVRSIRVVGYFKQIIGLIEYVSPCNLSVGWQVFQDIFYSASEVLFVITGFEFIYMLAPQSMQAVITGTFFTFIGAGELTTWCFYHFTSSLFTAGDYNVAYVFYFSSGGTIVYSIMFYGFAKKYNLELHRILFPQNSDT